MSNNRDPNTPKDPVGPYQIYCAGGLFTQDELTTNILLKEAVWRLSGGKFQLFLPQSREIQELEQPNVEAYLRNTDLLEVVRSDILLARFEGLGLDSGTVLEFTTAKYLGKPALILRTDFRRVDFGGLCDPYNLMVKNWPRTVEVQLHSFALWADLFVQERQGQADSELMGGLLEAELGTLQKSADEVARLVIDGLEEVIRLESPYPPQYREALYQAVRFSPGRGFEELLSAGELDRILERLRKNGTL